MAILQAASGFLSNARNVIILSAVLTIAGAFGYLYIRVQLAESKAATATAELETAQVKIKEQEEDIQRMIGLVNRMDDIRKETDRIVSDTVRENAKLRGTVKQLLTNYDKIVRIKPGENCVHQLIDSDVAEWLRADSASP